MEKNTLPSSAIMKEHLQAGRAVRRCTLMALLVSAVVSAPITGSVRTAAQSQLSYRIVSISAGASPSAARIGDLDGDGLNDIAVVNLQGSLQLLFNNGAGSFDRLSLNGLWPPSARTLDVDIGDLNGDGRNDIAVAFSTQTGAVSVLLNQGGRTFSAPDNYDSCNSSNGVVIGDLDHDGDNDLADISQCSKSSVLLNDGHGSLVLSGTYGNGSDSRSIALADFNRDGFEDIAYLNNGFNGNGSVTVIINNTNGTFGAPIHLYAGDLPDDLTVGDFDGDGNTDIAVSNSYYSLVIILLSNGQGSFPGYSELDGGLDPTNIASGDFNGDGRLDYAVTSWGNNSLSVFLNQGNYNFAAAGTFYVPQSPVGIAVGKLDDDSLPDLVVVNQGSGSITVLLSGADATPPPPPPPITVTVSTRTTGKARLVDLRWSGAQSTSVDIYRNGSRIATVSNTGTYTDQFGKRATGTYSYKVCAAGGQQCSNEAAISF